MYRCFIAAVFFVGLVTPRFADAAQDADPAKQPEPGASLGILVEPTAKKAKQTGVVVYDVLRGGAAVMAGMKKGDIITKADTQEVDGQEALLGFLARHKPGDKVTLQIQRDGKEQKLTVTLGSPWISFAEKTRTEGKGLAKRLRPAFLGVQTNPDAEQKGALVTGVFPNSSAAQAGLRKGDLITRLDDQPIASAKELFEAVRKAGVGKTVTVTAQRGDQKMEFKAKLEPAPELFREAPLGELPQGPGLFPRPPQLLEMPDRIRQLQERINELERRLRVLEQQKDKKGT